MARWCLREEDRPPDSRLSTSHRWQDRGIDTVPAQLHGGVPALEGGLRPLAVQVPQREAVDAASVDRYGRELLLGPGKVKHLPDCGGLLDVAGSLALGVVVHVAHLVQLVAKVGGSLHPGESVIVQDYRGRVGDLAGPAVEPEALALAPAGVGVGREQDVVGGGEHFGLLYHQLQGAAGECEEHDAIGEDGDTNKGVTTEDATGWVSG